MNIFEPRLRAFATFLALPILLGGCAGGPKAGPNYKTPRTTVGPVFGNANQAGYTTNQPIASWWRVFSDSRLDALIESAVTNNHDVRIATANVREARALRLTSQADLLPVINGTGGYTRERLSTAASLPGAPRQFQLFDAGFDATWELDFFGRVRRGLEASTAELQAIEADLRNVRIILISEVARNYFELRGAQNELDVAQRNAVNQRETLRITSARLDAGRGTELDLARARAQLNATLAIIPSIETTIARAMHRLAVLTGMQPTALTSELSSPSPLPALPAQIEIGNPENLLRRRPDVRAAERSLAAATARIGIAVADLFPRVTFNGTLGFEALTFSGLGNAGADTWSFGPHIRWAAFDLGHVRARIKAADARAEGALAQYEKTVLLSLEETENALVEFGREQQRRNFLRESVLASESAARLARERYENGASDFLTVLDAERVLLQAQDQFAQSETHTATSLVALNKALGGDWTKGSEPPQNR